MAKIKLSDFLVKRRIAFMLAAIAIAIGSVCLIPLTNINSDMSRYLPDDSQMKHGIDLMSEEFGDNGLGSGMVRVMFKSLPDSARTAIKDELSDIDGVANVIYIEGSDEYNQNEKALYELLGNSKRSQHELADDISERYGDLVIVETSEQDPTAPLGVMLIAFALLLTVLIIMCESWLEPPIFLAAIGVALAINMGTNALLESVSATTNSIAAILQLVLSIDYSIILMNRYRQEKTSGKNKVEAMSAALNKASSSIVSSAFTTIVGLLALVFMKLKIGADMGIVLAKGVLCSLVAIFTVLPTLIILLDSAIEKSKKRVLKFHTERLAGFSMKFRIPLAIFFVAIFAGSYWLHKKTDISFSIEQKSEIAKTFPPQNITALLYENSDSLKIIELADSISENPHVKTFLSYPSLLQKKYSAKETKVLLDEMTVMSSDIDLGNVSTTQIVNTLYYIKSGKLADEKISLHDFALLISDFATDTTFASKIEIPTIGTDSAIDTKQSLKLLVSLTDTSFINQKLTSEEISELLGIENEMISITCEDKTSITEVIQTAKELVNSMSEKPSKPKTNPTEPKPTSAKTETQNQANIATTDTTQTIAESVPDNYNIYTDSAKVHSQYSPAEIAEIIGMKEKNASTIFNLYGRTTGQKIKTMSLYEFIYFLNHDLSKRKIFASQFDKESREWLSNTESLMATTLNPAKHDAPTIETPVEQEKQDTLPQHTEPQGEKHDLNISIPTPKVNKEMLAMLDKAEKLTEIANEGKAFRTNEMQELLGELDTEIDRTMLDLAYLYHGSKNYENDSLKMSAEEILNLINDSIFNDEKFSSFIDDKMRSDMAQTNAMIDDNLGKLRGKNFSQAIIFSDYPKEAPETNEFVESLTAQCNSQLNGEHYLIGESVMMNEMRNQWGGEMLLVTLITIISIFLIVAITFRSLAVPAILVMTVMSAVYINVFVSGLIGNLLYLAYLIMQSILMGATIDYGILFANNYREARTSSDIKNAIRNAYKSSTHTIVTSGTIMTIAPLAMSFMMDDPTTIMILQCIAIGAFAAVMLIIFVLPGLLGAFDRFIAKRKKTK